MADGDITIITTIHPAKGGRRPITVAAAAAGELPTLLSGTFPDRHSLADQAFGAILKAQTTAAAKVIKKRATVNKAAKTRSKNKKQLPGHTSPGKVAAVLERVAASEPAFGKPGHLPTREPDQIGPDAPAAEPDDLPVIEGDEEAQLELEGLDG